MFFTSPALLCFNSKIFVVLLYLISLIGYPLRFCLMIFLFNGCVLVIPYSIFLLMSLVVFVMDKLSSRSIKCVIVRYSRIQKGYRYYNPATCRYLVSADVTFFESTPFFSNSSLTNPPIMVPLPSSVDTVQTESVVHVPTITVDCPLQIYTHRPKEA